MKVNFSIRHRHCQGITLIECLVYIGAVALVFGLGTTAFYRSFQNSADLRRNCDDISQAISAGELWRADLRRATAPPWFDVPAQTFYIPHGAGEIAYRFSGHQIERRCAATAGWKIILTRVHQSEMAPEARPPVAAWHWELELQTRRTPALLRPLFTFTAATPP